MSEIKSTGSQASLSPPALTPPAKRQKLNSYELFGSVQSYPSSPRVEPTKKGNSGKEKGVLFSQSASNRATKRVFGNGSTKIIQQLMNLLKEKVGQLNSLVEKIDSRAKEMGGKIDEKVGTEKITRQIRKLFSEIRSQIVEVRNQLIKNKEMSNERKAKFIEKIKTLEREVAKAEVELKAWRKEIFFLIK